MAGVAVRRHLDAAARLVRDAFSMLAAFAALAIAMRRARPVGVGGEDEEDNKG
jgi:hypothetical protein